MTFDDLPYEEIWVAHFEFVQKTGERPNPVCLVAKDLRTRQTLRVWHDQFGSVPPYRVDADVLFVCFYESNEDGCHRSDELACHRVLDWSMPLRILDLSCEFRNSTNGIPPPAGHELLGALTSFGLNTLGASEWETMRSLIARGEPWTITECEKIFDYCEGRVDAITRLLVPMLDKISLPHALLRGRYMSAVSAMEHAGIPIDVEMLSRLLRHWDAIIDPLIAAIDIYGAYNGRTFQVDQFAAWLDQNGIPWPRYASGRLDFSDDVFRQMAKAHTVIAPLRELRSSLTDLHLSDLAVGCDGRNRCTLSPFQSTTSRNQPSSKRYIFGTLVWTRGLIKPPEGMGLAYIDWRQQEFGIAAALSGDQRMQDAYRSGDVYLALAKQAGAVPPDATKDSHPDIRELYKAVVLGIGYGMEAHGLASRIGGPPVRARDLMRAHREIYRTFWAWSDQVVDFTILRGSIHTVFGWTRHIGPDFNPRSLRNHPMQANGAEILRLACCLATERGIEVVGPVHDALVIVAPIERLAEDVAIAEATMREASRVVLSGFELETDVKIAQWPDRYVDPRGARLWDIVERLINEAEGKTEALAKVVGGWL